MRFKSKTEEEIRSELLIPAGTYDFEVIGAEEKISKSGGNPMIELKLKVWLPDGSFRFVTDYIMEKVAYKLRHFACHVDLEAEYVNGVLDAQDCLGRGGRVQIRVDEAEGNYPEKNSVKDYGEPQTKPKQEREKSQKPAAATPKTKVGEVATDDIPF